MKNMLISQLKQFICLAFFLCGISCLSDDQFNNYILATNPVVRNHKLDTNIIAQLKIYSNYSNHEAVGLYEKYLIEVFDDSKSSKAMKETSVALLGKLRTKKAIKCLIKNIDFKSDDCKSLPALASIVDVGEESIPYLIEGIESGDLSDQGGRMRIYFIVKAIREIKNDKFKTFYDDAMNRYSIKVQEALRKCTVN